MTKRILKQNAFLIILISLLIIGFWISFYSIINQTRENEKLEFFFTATSINETYFKEQVKNTIKIKEVDFSVCDESNEYYSVLLETNGIISADLLVTKSDLFLNSATATSYVALTDEILNQYGIKKEDFTFVSIDEVPYAIILHSSDIHLFDDEIKYYNADETYVIGINSGSTKQEQALKVLSAILNSK